MMDIAAEDLGPMMAEAEEAEPVTCRVCDIRIDSVTGEPVEEVTADAVAAVQQYMQTSGQNEEGGVALIEQEDAL